MKCADNTLYTGVATDIARRFEEHQSQGHKSAKYTRGRGPLKLIYRKEIGNRSQACIEEYRIKQLTKAEKLALITDDFHALT